MIEELRPIAMSSSGRRRAFGEFINRFEMQMSPAMGDVTRFPKRGNFVEAGGLVDETHVAVGIYGEDLDPEEVSDALGRLPTSAHRKGEPRKNGPPWPHGAWLTTVEGKSPQGPAELLAQLLALFPSDPEVWSALHARYMVRVSFGIFMSRWNRGFELPTAATKLLHEIGAEVSVDIYADFDEGDR